MAARARASVRGIFSSEACIFFDVILTQRTRHCAIDVHFIFIMCVLFRAEAKTDECTRLRLFVCRRARVRERLIINVSTERHIVFYVMATERKTS